MDMKEKIIAKFGGTNAVADICGVTASAAAPTIAQALAAARTLGLDRIDAQWLLGHVLQQPSAWLISHDDQPLVAATAQVLHNGLKVLGVSKATRMPLLGQVPTIAEQGVKGFESGTWQGMLVPAATPPAVLTRLSAEVTRIIRSPEVRERLVSQGAEVYTMTPPEFSSFFERERKNWAGVVAAGGVKID